MAFEYFGSGRWKLIIVSLAASLILSGTCKSLRYYLAFISRGRPLGRSGLRLLSYPAPSRITTASRHRRLYTPSQQHPLHGQGCIRVELKGSLLRGEDVADVKTPVEVAVLFS